MVMNFTWFYSSHNYFFYYVVIYKYFDKMKYSRGSKIKLKYSKIYSWQLKDSTIE
jgi:hypothetical protein